MEEKLSRRRRERGMMYRYCAFFCFPGVLLTLFYLFSADIRYTSVVTELSGELYALSLWSNAFSPWEEDLFRRVVHFFAGRDPSDPLHFAKYSSTLSSILLALGLGFWHLQRGSTHWRGAAGIALSLCFFHFLYGINATNAALICWLPWLLGSCWIRVPLLRSIAVGSSSLLLVSASPVAALLFLPFFLGEWSEARGSTRGIRALGLLLALLLVCFHLLTSTSEPFFPDYPPTGHIVTDDGVAGFTRPLTGISPPIPVVNRTALKEALFFPALFLILGALLHGFFSYFRSATAFPTRGTLPLLFLTLCLALDVLLPEALAMIAPLETFRRVVPSAFLIAPATLVCGALLVTASSSLHPLILALAFGFTMFFIPGGRPPLLGALASPSSDSLVKRYQSAKNNGILLRNGSRKKLDEKELAQLRKVFFSPSFAVIQYYDLSMRVLLAPHPTHLRYSRLRHHHHPLPLHLSASPNSLLEPETLVDKRFDTRVRVGRGGQRGGEFLCIESEQAMKRVRLTPGDFFTDFPRGLLVGTGERCADKKELLRTAKRYAPWEGSLHFTDKGFPYFGHQAIVELPLEKPAKAILLQQTEVAYFDWSIAELKVAFAKRAHHSEEEKSLERK
ncbi:hypothetical protein MRY87_09540 [bacterium]|nr:hypothetical protein [bacterium]